MGNTWVIDIRHSLDDDGQLAVKSGSARNRGSGADQRLAGNEMGSQVQIASKVKRLPPPPMKWAGIFRPARQNMRHGARHV